MGAEDQSVESCRHGATDRNREGVLQQKDSGGVLVPSHSSMLKDLLSAALR